MLRTRSPRQLRFIGALILVLAGGAVLVYFCAREPSTRATAFFGPLQVPADEDPASVQLDEPSEVIDPDGKDIQLDEGREDDWVESGNPKSIPVLIRYLKDHQERIRCMALAEFAGMGSEGKSAVAAIVEALDDPSSSIRLKAASSLIHMNVQSKVAVRALMRELRADDATSRERAAEAIGELIDPPAPLGNNCWGPSPPPRIARPWVGKLTLPALLEAQHDREEAVRAAAEQTLSKLQRFVTVQRVIK